MRTYSHRNKWKMHRFFLFLQSEWVRPIPCFLTATGMDTLTDPQLGTISFVRRARARRIVVRILPDGLRVTLPPLVPGAGGACASSASTRTKLPASRTACGAAGRQASCCRATHPPCTPALSTCGWRSRRAPTCSSGCRGIHYIYTSPTRPTSPRPPCNASCGTGWPTSCGRRRTGCCPPRLHELATAHGFDYRGVKIQPSRTRWGSCSARGDINLSYHLMLVPPHLADYVMLHELCHTREMNHSPRFWQLMDSVTGGRAKALRTEPEGICPSPARALMGGGMCRFQDIPPFRAWREILYRMHPKPLWDFSLRSEMTAGLVRGLCAVPGRDGELRYNGNVFPQ